MSAHISLRIATALATAARFATTAALKWWTIYLRALRETREREAARLIARYRPADNVCRFECAEMETSRQPRTSRLGPLSVSEIMMFKSNSKTAE